MNAASGAGSRITWCSRSSRMYSPLSIVQSYSSIGASSGWAAKEHEVGEQPGAASVAVDEGMDADRLGVDGDAEHARGPV